MAAAVPLSCGCEERLRAAVGGADGTTPLGLCRPTAAPTRGDSELRDDEDGACIIIIRHLFLRLVTRSVLGISKQLRDNTTNR
jgi:hypothetical protein